MRLDVLCELVLEYEDDSPVVVRTPFEGSGGQGFGVGTGRSEGILAGQVRWANFPRLREDGVFLPEACGVVTTSAGPVLFRLSGISLPPDQQDRRRLVGSARFFTGVESLQWLNDSVGVHEGALDVTSGEVRLQISVCVPDDR